MKIKQGPVVWILLTVIIVLFTLWLLRVDIGSNRQQAGVINISLGFLLLASYLGSRVLQLLKMPLITGYIMAGIIAGPFVTGLISLEMVADLRLMDDLALGFIAFAAGGELRLRAMKGRGKSIVLNIIFQTLAVFAVVFIAVMTLGPLFNMDKLFTRDQLIVVAIILGVISAARSPSSAIAVINECMAEGPFTRTVLGVTMAMDVLIIIFFALALFLSKTILGGGHGGIMWALSFEIALSLLLGLILGLGISLYIGKKGPDLSLLLLFISFGVAKVSQWFNIFMVDNFHIFLRFEPLLICMAAGFVVQNFGKNGDTFTRSLESAALPVYVLFFSLVGASLDIGALRLFWPLAVCLVCFRAIGIFLGSWTAGKIGKDPSEHNKNAWMAYLSQAGVSIGMAQLAGREIPGLGDQLITIVLSVIALNQLIGPVALKAAIGIVCESKLNSNG